MAGRPALLIQGDFQNGPRVYVIVLVDEERILVLGAFPTYSSRVPDFDRVVRYLTFEPPP